VTAKIAGAGSNQYARRGTAKLQLVTHPAALIAQAQVKEECQPSEDLSVLVDGRHPRLVVDPSGFQSLVLTDEDEQWAPTPPDGFLPLAEIMTFRPTERPGTWKEMEACIAAEQPKLLEALVGSLRRDGMLTPIEIDMERRCVERGHHRVVAARIAGLETVPYIAGRREERWCWSPTTGTHQPYYYDLDAFDE